VVLRYAITDRAQFPGTDVYRLKTLVHQVQGWASNDINFVQIREKDLAAGELADLARRVIAAARASGDGTKILVNSRADVAAAVSADGVHLTSSPGELTVSQVRQVYAGVGLPAPLISRSCHTLADVGLAVDDGVDAILFGPVFGKVQDGLVVVPWVGLEVLRNACELASGSVFALGGLTEENAADCVAAGAVGIAGIRLFASV
jgi:thiamine-phosphate pyrophosphorylase